MATITLYKNKVNGVGSFIDDIIKSSNNLDTQLGTLKNTLQGVDSSTCNLQAAVDSISSSSKSEKEKVEDLKKLNNQLTTFIETTSKKEAAVKEEIERSKNDFYKKYSYLKPECEKSGWEKFCEAVGSVCEWCVKHWKLIATIALVIVSIVLLCTGVGSILAGACWGAIFGALIGGVSGGLESLANGGSFLDGFENGAFSGAVSGFIMGGAFAGLGSLGAALGKGISCASKFGKFIKGVAAVTKVMSTAMSSFDTLAMLDGMFGSGKLAELNAKLHSSTAYNVFQFAVSATAAFTGGMASTMQCFAAGTLVATINGLYAIEHIKAGDQVLAADEETFQKVYKPVLETYSFETDKLIHLTINGETVVTTMDHPFYVNNRGFVNACMLCIGDELLDKDGNVLVVEQIYREELNGETRTVYNFKVDEFHTYFVGDLEIWVHNAQCNPRRPRSNLKGEKDNGDGTITYTKEVNGQNVDVTYSKDGYPDFSPFKNQDVKPNPVPIEMTGNNAVDFKAANQACNLPGSKAPKGFTWHHMEDGKNMILVRSDVHNAFPHTGGASIARAAAGAL